MCSNTYSTMQTYMYVILTWHFSTELTLNFGMSINPNWIQVFSRSFKIDTSSFTQTISFWVYINSWSLYDSRDYWVSWKYWSQSADYPVTPTSRTTLQTTLNNQPNLLLWGKEIQQSYLRYLHDHKHRHLAFRPFLQPSPSYCNLTLCPVRLDPLCRKLRPRDF